MQGGLAGRQAALRRQHRLCQPQNGRKKEAARVERPLLRDAYSAKSYAAFFFPKMVFAPLTARMMARTKSTAARIA